MVSGQLHAKHEVIESYAIDFDTAVNAVTCTT